MNSRSDSELLAEYVRAGSREAFTELVARHRDWVHSVAVRRVHDEHLADDVTQAVFIVLARRARGIKEGTVLSAWLFGVARYAAANAARGEARRKKHEAAAATMRPIRTTDERSDAADDVISEALDLAVANLGGMDRTAVLLRFYEQRSLAEVGLALSISEDAARKRVDRAVEKLRVRLAGTGATTEVSARSVGALTSWLQRYAVHAAAFRSPTLATAALTAAHSPGAVGTSITLAKGAIRMLIWNKIKWIGAICLLALIPVAVTHIQFIFREAAQPGAVADQAQTGPSTTSGEIHYAPILVLTVANIQKSVDFYSKFGFVIDDAPSTNPPGTQVKGGIVRIKFVQGDTTDADRAARRKDQLQLNALSGMNFSRDQFSEMHDSAAAAGIKTGDLIAVNGVLQFSVVDPDGYLLVLQYQ